MLSKRIIAFVAISASIACLLSGPHLWSWAHGRSLHETRSEVTGAVTNAPASHLTVQGGRWSLGVVEGGVPVDATIPIGNESDRTITLDRLETTCPCLSLEPCPLVFGARETRSIAVRFDPASEPDFRGKLLIGVVGKAARDEEALNFRVEIEVR